MVQHRLGIRENGVGHCTLLCLVASAVTGSMNIVSWKRVTDSPPHSALTAKSQTLLGDRRKEGSTCLGFDLIVQELLFELGESVVGAVVVQIQGVEDVPVKGHRVMGGPRKGLA